MAQTKTDVTNKPAWVDLAAADPQAAHDWYGKLFGWQVQVSPDPQYGGYAMAQVDGQDVAGIGGKQSPEQPTVWQLYIGTTDAQATATKVEQAGGKVIAPPFDVGDQGRMAVFQDPAGTFISVWQPTQMSGFISGRPSTYAWAELNARGIDKAIPFYEQVFGWTTKTSPMGEGQPDYTEFQLDGQSIAGGFEMPSQVPSQVPSHWMVYFAVEDVDQAFSNATQSGGQGTVQPQDFPGGRFAIVIDPQGAAFGLLKMQRSQS